MSAQAQPGMQRAYATGYSDWLSNSVLQDGGTLLCGYSNFNYDSTWLRMIYLNSSSGVEWSRAWKTSPVVLSFMNNVTAVDNGFLFCGIGSPNLGDFHPYLVKTDDNGHVNWAKWFDNLSFGSHQLMALVPDENQFTVYSFPDGPTTGFYRIWGDLDGNSMKSISISNPAYQASMRIYQAVPCVNKAVHLLAGTGAYVSTGNGSDALLMRVDTTNVKWSKVYDFGSPIWEVLQDVVMLSDDSAIAVGFSQADATSIVTSFIMKVDSAGEIAWCKQLTLDNILELFSITQTADGNFIASGLNANYEGILIKVSRNGDLIWSRKWTPDTFGLTYFSAVNQDAGTNEIVVTGTHGGMITVLRLNENGDGCDFENLTTLQAIDFNPESEILPVVTDPFTTHTQEEILLDRPSSVTPQDLCITGVPAVASLGVMKLTPNPSDAAVEITLAPSFIHANISIYDVAGREVHSFPDVVSPLQISVAAFSPGVYVVQTISNGKIFREKLLVQ
jgi:hypothetical protein